MTQNSPHFRDLIYRRMSFKGENKLNAYLENMAPPESAASFTSTSWDEASVLDYATRGKEGDRRRRGGQVGCSPLVTY